MNTDQAQTQIETNTSDPVAVADKLSFSDYEKMRRGVQVESKEPKSEPLSKSEAQKEAKSEIAKKEAKDDSSDDLDDESEDLNESEKDKPKKKGGFQRRIDKLNARYSAAQAEVEHWKAQALKGKNEPENEPKVESTKKEDSKPTPDEFQTHAEYVEALTDWKIEQKEKIAKAEQEKSKLISEHEKRVASHLERVKAFSEKNDDFQEVLESVDHIPVSLVVQDIILSSENGPELMYELAKNKDEYERINKLAPLAAARAIGIIESKIASKESQEKQETKKITKAPNPISPVGGNAGSTIDKSLDDPSISYTEYERKRREQMKRRGR